MKSGVMAAAATLVAVCAAMGVSETMPAAEAQSSRPAVPSNLAATSTSSTVTLTWDNPRDSSITGYTVFYRHVATQSILTILSDTGSAATSYTVGGLQPSAEYQFAVMASNRAGNSGISQIVTVFTQAQTGQPPPPQPPTPTTPTPPVPPTTPTIPAPPPASADIAALTNAIRSLTSLIGELSMKITALEARIAAQDGPAITDDGDFIPIYYTPTDSYNRVQQEYFEDQRFLERFTERLTQTMILPYDVYLTMDECNEPNAFYFPDYKQVVICYEYVTFLENVLDPYYATDEELYRGVDEFVTWVMLHELGHALVDVYDLPITGNEEDAVDQFATIIALEYIPAGQLGSNLYPTLLVWDRLGEFDVFPTEGDLGGPHSLSSQRFYNVACWMYGSNTHAYSGLAGLLPEGRASQCQYEYERMSESWYRLGSPYLKNPGSIPPP